MDIKETVSVWLKVKDGENHSKFILQKRSTENKTFPYICQATWAGKVEDGEKVDMAIKRECEEEVGKQFCDSFIFNNLRLIENNEFMIGEQKYICHNYLGDIFDEQIKLINLHKEALPELIFLDKSDEIYPVSSGKDPINSIVLFDDQYKVLKKILNNGY